MLALLVGDVAVAVGEEGRLRDVGHSVTGEVDGGRLEHRFDGPRVGQAGVKADRRCGALAATRVTHDSDVAEVHGADQVCWLYLSGLRGGGLPGGQRLVQTDGLLGLSVEKAHRLAPVSLLQPGQSVEEFLPPGGGAVVGRQLVVIGVDGVGSDGDDHEAVAGQGLRRAVVAGVAIDLAVAGRTGPDVGGLQGREVVTGPVATVHEDDQRMGSGAVREVDASLDLTPDATDVGQSLRLGTEVVVGYPVREAAWSRRVAGQDGIAGGSGGRRGRRLQSARPESVP